MITKKVRIGQPYKRILVNANIVRCKHPEKKYKDFEKFKQGEVYLYGEDYWKKKYDNYDNLESIKSGDLILTGREDKGGGEIVNKLLDVNAKWRGSKEKIYRHTLIFYKVLLLEDLPKEVEIENDIEINDQL